MLNRQFVCVYTASHGDRLMTEPLHCMYAFLGFWDYCLCFILPRVERYSVCVWNGWWLRRETHHLIRIRFFCIHIGTNTLMLCVFWDARLCNFYSHSFFLFTGFLHFSCLSRKGGVYGRFLFYWFFFRNFFSPSLFPISLCFTHTICLTPSLFFFFPTTNSVEGDKESECFFF